MDYFKLKEIHNTLNDTCWDTIRTLIGNNSALADQLVYSDGCVVPLSLALDTALQYAIQDAIPEIERVIDQDAAVEYQKGFDDAFESNFDDIKEAEADAYERGFEAGIEYRDEEIRGEGTY